MACDEIVVLVVVAGTLVTIDVGIGVCAFRKRWDFSSGGGVHVRRGRWEVGGEGRGG